MMLRVARIVPSTRAEGPGLRSAVWVAGCSIRCHGCFNPHLFDPAGGNLMSPEQVAERMLSLPEIEGISVLGGEPFDQAVPLSRLARLAHQSDKSVMVYTGYRYEHLLAGRVDGADQLLQEVDILIDGPFIASRIDRQRPWLGSTNQRVLRLTGEIAEGEGSVDRLEIRIASDGRLEVNGWATPDQIAELRALIEDESEP